MVVRPIAIAISLSASACMLIAPTGPVENAAVELPLRVYYSEPPSPALSGDARPCLIDTESCLELSPAPFAPCLTALERCGPEARVELLAGRDNETQR